MSDFTAQELRAELSALAAEWRKQLREAAMTQTEKYKRERTVAALDAAIGRINYLKADRDLWHRFAVEKEREVDSLREGLTNE